jgi:hypothetical protein
MAALSRYTGLLVAIILVLLLADVVIAGRLVANRASLPPGTSNTTQSERQAAAHPCNHGYYVSQAAHSKKGGGYVSGIARSNLGKNGSCTAPLPAQAPAATKGSGDHT